MVRFVKNTSRVFYVAYRYSIHAEVSCILKCKQKQLIAKSKMIIIKLIDNKPVICEPCNSCYLFIKKHNIKKIYNF
jgi:hypothetical protein